MGIFGYDGKKVSQVKMENYETFMKSPQYFKYSILDNFVEKYQNEIEKKYSNINDFIQTTQEKLKNEKLTPSEVEALLNKFKKNLDEFVKNITVDDDRKKEIMFYLKVFDKIDDLTKQRDEYLALKYKPLLDYTKNTQSKELEKLFGKNVDKIFTKDNLKKYKTLLNELYILYKQNGTLDKLDSKEELNEQYENYKDFFTKNGLNFPNSEEEIEGQYKTLSNLKDI